MFCMFVFVLFLRLFSKSYESRSIANWSLLNVNKASFKTLLSGEGEKRVFGYNKSRERVEVT